MPTMSGYEVAKRIREVWPSSLLPIIMVREACAPAPNKLHTHQRWSSRLTVLHTSSHTNGLGSVRASAASLLLLGAEDSVQALLSLLTANFGIRLGASSLRVTHFSHNHKCILTWPARTPFLQLSAKTDEADIVQGVRCGPGDYMPICSAEKKLVKNCTPQILWRDTPPLSALDPL